MTKHGSDKGAGWHNQTTVYPALFRDRHDRPLRTFELGTNDRTLPSTIGSNGRPGASLRGWRKLFPRSRVYGADMDRDTLLNEGRIKTSYCHQRSRPTIQSVWLRPGPKEAMDIIGEDGLHSFEANVSFFGESITNLHPSGVYVVEDIALESIGRWPHRIEAVYLERYPGHEFGLAMLSNPSNHVDNNLLIISRASQ